MRLKNKLTIFEDRYSVEVKSPPCPFCKKRIKLYRHWSDRTISHVVLRHCIPTWKRAANRSDEEQLIIETHYGGSSEAIRAAWTAQCIAVVRQAREAVRHENLSSEALRAAQSRGGRNQLKRDKRLGGENQSTEDKAHGGEIGMHNRWHVKRGVKKPGCEFCALLVDSGAATTPPSTS